MATTPGPPVDAGAAPDPIALSYPLTGLAAVAAMAAVIGAIAEVLLAHQLSRPGLLLSPRALATLNGHVAVLVASLGLLLLLIGAELAPRGSTCLSGGRLALVAHSARLASDFLAACAALVAARCVGERPRPALRLLLLLLFLLAWPFAAFLILLRPLPSSQPRSGLPVASGAAAAILLSFDWALWVLCAVLEIARAASQRRHKRVEAPGSLYSPESGPSLWSGTEVTSELKDDPVGSRQQLRTPQPHRWGVHPAVLALQVLLLAPLSASAFQEHQLGASALLAVRWLFLYLLVLLGLLHCLLHGLDMHARWRSLLRRRTSTADLNEHLVPSTLQEIQRLEEEAKMPGVLAFRAVWRYQGLPQRGILRVFAPSARHLWSAEAAAAQLLTDAPHANLCRYLWSNAKTPFHAGLACVADEVVTKAWRVTCRLDLDRGSLAALIRDEAYCLSEGFIFETVTDLARALLHLRRLNLVHGRVAPEAVSLRGLRDGSVRAVLCDFHRSRRLVDLSLCMDGLSDQSFAYSLSSRSGLLDALKDQQFAPDLRSLLLLLLHLLLVHMDRGSALSLARASISPSLQRVAEVEEVEEEEEGERGSEVFIDGTTRKEEVYEPLDSMTPRTSISPRRSQTPVIRRQQQRRSAEPPTTFDNPGFEMREDLSSSDTKHSKRHYENLPRPSSRQDSQSVESGSSEPSAAQPPKPDLVKTALEQRRRIRQKGATPSTNGPTPRPPSTPAVLSHEEEYCLRLAREHPKWIEATALIGRDRSRLQAVARAMRGGLSQLGADMADFALTAWTMEPCLSAESFLRSLKAITPRSAL